MQTDNTDLDYTPQPAMTAKNLAALMGVTESDLAGFVACLKVWTDKGYSVEQAIGRHMATMAGLLTNVSDGFSRTESRHHEAAVALKGAAASMVWDAVNGVAA